MNGTTHARRIAALTLAVLTAINFLNYIDRYVLAAVLEGVRAEFGIFDTASGLLGSMFVVVYMIASPFTGWLGDRIPRKLLVAAGVGLWSLATAGSGLAGSYEQLLVARALVGVGEAGYATVAPAMIADLYAERERGRKLAWFYLATPVGSALGFVLGGAVAEQAPALLTGVGLAPDAVAGWRLSFLVAGVPGLVFAIAAACLREPVRGGSEGEPVTAAPGGLRRVFRSPAWRIVTVGSTLMTFTLGGLAFWMPSFLQRVHGMPEGDAGVVFGGVTVVAGLVGTVAGGYLGDHAQARSAGGYLRVSAVGLLFGAPLVALTAAFGSLPPALAAAFACELLLFLNTGPLNAALVGCVPAGVRATAVAVNVFFIHALGDAISPLVMGGISDAVADALGGGPDGLAAGLRVAVALSAIPVAVGGGWLLRGARRLERLPGGLRAET